ncbi:phosphate ABC transporter, permease protein PstA [Vibrio sp. 10N.286.49.B3]|uniref:phosphate ABC transporter permease PstA n=1 Tax=Vibrio sp. 10N.286.49.B3 TaxID=1880855 RepID=UPI000C816E45|nr:phosphate ABC transporter permease PstA [Vibrio sp. 10N.286.49.B3]PMH37578.1 phosphate ABC transporter, permease protein PstA [Vibrio sp. 10N.286.49.B3]
MFKWLKSGSPWIWLTGGAVSISLLSVLGLLLLIGWKGLTYFWPAPLYQWQVNSSVEQVHTLQDSVNLANRDEVPVAIIGELYHRETVLADNLNAADRATLPAQQHSTERLNIKIANRDLYSADFIAVLESRLLAPTTPHGLVVVERARGGYFFGRPVSYQTSSAIEEKQIEKALTQGVERSSLLRQSIDDLVNQEIKRLSWQLEKLRLDKRKKDLNNTLTNRYIIEHNRDRAQLIAKLTAVEAELDDLKRQLEAESLSVEDMTGQIVTIPLSQILDFWYPNDMTYLDKLGHWGVQVWKFITDNPRESNSEGGVFPAIFGTVLMVLIMAIVVMPLGVIAAIYLHEYAKNNAFTRVIRIAVINLAGVPSIVYGVFGLGFFVYTIGGSIDSLFYAERLPAPTFGTPGLLWSALTLAVLTLPVVIVTTEEGLSRIPSSVRHGSLALGATQFETMWRIILPMASPAIITGLILAIARAAGEVAPLMMVGVVKLASSLPVDDQFPYIHLDRKFMHLGFHIYDVGFQTTNIEAARPLVYATSFLLVTVIIGLNLTAISIRNNLRETYRTLGQD